MKCLKRVLAGALCLWIPLAGAAAPLEEGQPMELTSPSAILAEAATGTVIFEKNADERREVASITKLMTALLTFEALEQGDAQQKGCSPMKVSSFDSKPKIEPLVKSKWNQGDPYNLMTPSYVDANGNTVAHSATGCVATATTQVMYYWKCPQEACKEIPSYTYNWSGNKRTYMLF